MGYSFSGKIEGNMAKASDPSAQISFKEAQEIANLIRGRTLKFAEGYLNEVLVGKKAVSYKIFNKDVPHRKGLGPGRYPVKTIKYILELFKNLKANAKARNLDADKLKIVFFVGERGNKSYGSRRGNRVEKKSCKLYIIASSEAVAVEKKTKKAEVAKEVNTQKSEQIPGNVKKPGGVFDTSEIRGISSRIREDVKEEMKSETKKKDVKEENKTKENKEVAEVKA